MDTGVIARPHSSHWGDFCAWQESGGLIVRPHPNDPVVAEDDAPLSVHGNPNVLTRDIGTSSQSQGCSGQLTCIEVDRFNRNVLPIRAYEPPATSYAGGARATRV